MKAKYALPMVLAGSVMLSGCWLDDDDNDDNGTTEAATQSILEIAVENANTTILEAAVLEADPSIAELLGGDDQLTAFAPTDAAFEALLGDLGLTAEQLLANTELLNAVLTYHVLATSVGEVKAAAAISVAQSPVPQNLVPTVNGENVALSISQENGEDVLYVNTSRVTGPDVDATNGVIHLIDKVLLPPPSDLSDTDSTIAEIVTALAGAENAEFTTLLAALQTPGAAALLTAASDVDATLTVFAPTDAAFEALLTDLGITAGDLLNDPNLPAILSQHILGTTVGSLTAYASNGGTVTTLASNNLNVDIQDNALVIEGSTVVEADVEASNGVIHVIDEVIFTVD
ncbi:fasciclin domain-containing protein [Marinobacter nauticus]|uniref:Surface protein with fasciclin (FAS1) repeats n=1 Tax=Marinobacter nauticus TaxID=2743 RepID=A0A368UZF7_MARNT|nr:fasciclin domain-containing protein [Marinobacter nauticus]RBP73398.1 putative surface protein with fasciclin (FAS1) repeats [Marinobacter nauticus]RCW34218.1 putative surface protein with fasciclin (FAS1) repeats [Marinobacter nauticus]